MEEPMFDPKLKEALGTGAEAGPLYRRRARQRL